MVRRMRRGRRAPRRRYGAARKRYLGKRGVLVAPGIAKKVHWFKELYQSTSFVGTANSFTGGIFNCNLNELANAPSFKALFDLYKITGVKLKIIPRWNVDQATAGNVNGQMGNLPVLYIAPNHDPYVPVPTNLSDILNDDGCRIIRLTRPINLFLKNPKPKLVTEGSAGEQDVPIQFNSSSRALQPWLTTGGNAQTIDQSGVNHYGYRYMISNETALDCVLDVYATLYFCMKEQD